MPFIGHSDFYYPYIHSLILLLDPFFRIFPMFSMIHFALSILQGYCRNLLTYWHIDILTYWHIDILTYWLQWSHFVLNVTDLLFCHYSQLQLEAGSSQNSWLFSESAMKFSSMAFVTVIFALLAFFNFWENQNLMDWTCLRATLIMIVLNIFDF